MPYTSRSSCATACRNRRLPGVGTLSGNKNSRLVKRLRKCSPTTTIAERTTCTSSATSAPNRLRQAICRVSSIISCRESPSPPTADLRPAVEQALRVVDHHVGQRHDPCAVKCWLGNAPLTLPVLAVAAQQSLAKQHAE